jgi:hypothetical protein
MRSGRFEVNHDILIDASPAVAFDYLSNPASWPEWRPTSHHIDCPGNPLGLGASVHERWQTCIEARIEQRARQTS